MADASGISLRLNQLFLGMKHDSLLDTFVYKSKWTPSFLLYYS